MKTLAIIQARVGSSRLPGKVLRDVAGKTMLARVIDRVRCIAGVNEALVATTREPADQAIVDECDRLGTPSFLGSQTDVLDRYYQAAMAYKADAVVRITSDCPLLDPQVAERVVSVFHAGTWDYVSNTLERTFPRGLDTEIMSARALARAWREADKPYQRAHVTPYFQQNPQIFRLRSVTSGGDFGDMRWTVDTAEDLEFVRAVYARLSPGAEFGWHEVRKLLKQEPQLAELNSHVRQKALEEC